MLGWVVYMVLSYQIMMHTIQSNIRATAGHSDKHSFMYHAYTHYYVEEWQQATTLDCYPQNSPAILSSLAGFCCSSCNRVATLTGRSDRS